MTVHSWRVILSFAGKIGYVKITFDLSSPWVNNLPIVRNGPRCFLRFFEEKIMQFYILSSDNCSYWCWFFKKKSVQGKLLTQIILFWKKIFCYFMKLNNFFFLHFFVKVRFFALRIFCGCSFCLYFLVENNPLKQLNYIWTLLNAVLAL